MNIPTALLQNLYLLPLMFLFYKENFSYATAEALPRRADISNDKKILFAHVKQQLEMKCPIERTDASDTPLYFDWFKGDVSLYNEKGYTFSKKGILKIKSVTKDHAGIYQCEAVNGYGTLRINITLIVDDPESENENRTFHNSASRVSGIRPTIKKRFSTSAVHDLGGQATFHCAAYGTPTPHLFFFKDGQLLQDTESEISNGHAHATLRLRGLQKTDAGIYKCIARNKIGEDEVDYTLHVADPAYPPRITSLEPSRATIKEGSTAVFWCEVKSKPGLKLHIKWLKRLNKKEIGDPMNMDDVTLFRSGKTYYRPLNLSDGSETNGVHKSKLIIQNAFKEDSGIYVCLALNDKGYNFKNATLTVISTVKPLSSTSYFSTKSTSFVVTVVTALVIVLTAVMMVTYFYCRGKNVIPEDPVIKSESKNLNPISTSIKKHGGKHPDIKDLQAKANLLCGDLSYNCEHTEHQISRSMHVKNYMP